MFKKQEENTIFAFEDGLNNKSISISGLGKETIDVVVKSISFGSYQPFEYKSFYNIIVDNITITETQWSCYSNSEMQEK